MFSSLTKLVTRPVVVTNQLTRCFASTTAGTVKWFDVKKGFGFIAPSDGTTDVFVHHSSIHSEGFRSLADGEAVEFTVATDERGRRRADHVTGPDGSFVQGAPRRFSDFGGEGGHSDYGFGGGGGGGGDFGGGGFRDGGNDFANDDADDAVFGDSTEDGTAMSNDPLSESTTGSSKF